MPSVHHNLIVSLGATVAENRITVLRRDTFRIAYPGSGFTFRYTDGFPFLTTDPLAMHRPSGEEREATVAGTFPFLCFFNGAEIRPTPGGPAVAGEVIVDPQERG